jgi:CheY-like chemotaxis protein
METVNQFSNKRLLLVEDNEMNIKVFSFLLKRINIPFDVVADGREALALLSQNEYHIVLTDINLPQLSGDEMTKIIRVNNNEAIAKLPIIALTASKSKEEETIYLAAGINEVLLKPFTEADLRNLLNNYLN